MTYFGLVELEQEKTCRTRSGALLGAAFLIVLPELIRLFGLPADIAANLRQVFYGLTLVLIVGIKGGGLLGGSRYAR